MLQWWRRQSCKYTFFTWNFSFAQNIVIFRSDSVLVPAGWLICRISRKWTRSMANVSFELPLAFLVPFHSLIVELWECLSSNYQIVVSEFQMLYACIFLIFYLFWRYLHSCCRLPSSCTCPLNLSSGSAASERQDWDRVHRYSLSISFGHPSSHQ